jgi:hypothetical protein
MEEEHTDLENERLREMLHYILMEDWTIEGLSEEEKSDKCEWTVTTTIRILEKGGQTAEIGNFLMEQETKILERSGDRLKSHDIAKKLSFAYHKLNTKERDNKF